MWALKSLIHSPGPHSSFGFISYTLSLLIQSHWPSFSWLNMPSSSLLGSLRILFHIPLIPFLLAYLTPIHDLDLSVRVSSSGTIPELPLKKIFPLRLSHITICYYILVHMITCFMSVSPPDCKFPATFPAFSSQWTPFVFKRDSLLYVISGWWISLKAPTFPSTCLDFKLQFNMDSGLRTAFYSEIDITVSQTWQSSCSLGACGPELFEQLNRYPQSHLLMWMWTHHKICRGPGRHYKWPLKALE